MEEKHKKLLKKAKGKIIKITFDDGSFVFGVYIKRIKYTLFLERKSLSSVYPLLDEYSATSIKNVEIISNSHAAFFLNKVRATINDLC